MNTRLVELRSGETVRLTLPDGVPVLLGVGRIRTDRRECQVGVEAPPSVHVQRSEVKDRPAQGRRKGRGKMAVHGDIVEAFTLVRGGKELRGEVRRVPNRSFAPERRVVVRDHLGFIVFDTGIQPSRGAALALLGDWAKTFGGVDGEVSRSGGT